MKYAAVIQYGNRDQIVEVRPRHRQYLTALKEQGKLWASGPFTDDSGALIVYEADTEDEARQLIENDPFRQAGVFVSFELRAWNQVF